MPKSKDDLSFARARLKKEAVISSAIAGLIIGFAVNFIVALICWLCGFLNIWLSIGLGIASAAIGGVLLYFLRFRPDTHAVAKRVDALGLEERVVTMLELKEETSYIAQTQRRDAEEKLSKVRAKNIRLAVSRVLILLVCVFGVLSAGMTTVSALAVAGVLPSGDAVLQGRDRFLEVSYLVEEGGEIVGDPEQLVLPGEDAEPVMAVADEGWTFIGWDDGVDTPYREDTAVQESFLVTALFEQLDEEDEDPDAPSAGEGDDEEAPDIPGDGNGDNGGESESGSGEGESGEGSGNGENGDVGEGDGKGQGNGAGGRFEENNKVIDGDTYYKDELDDYYREVLELLESDGELTDEEREFLEKYFGSL